MTWQRHRPSIASGNRPSERHFKRDQRDESSAPDSQAPPSRHLIGMSDDEMNELPNGARAVRRKLDLIGIGFVMLS